jgi:hypothetical protein
VAPLVAWLGPWAAAVAHHHERWDGTGYPRGLAGEDISLGGRILAIADAYEVMTAARPYKSPQRPHAARQELVAAAGEQFDPVLVRHFLAVSLGKLWWLIGGSAFLSLVPWLAGLWTVPAGAAIRRTGSGPVTAAAAVGALALAGVVAPVATPLRAGTAPVETAAPVTTPEAALAPTTEVAAAGLPPAGIPLEIAAPGLPPAVLPAVVPPPVTEPGPAPVIPAADGPAASDPAAVPPAGSPPPAPVPPGPLFSASGTLLLPGLLGLTSAQMQSGCGTPASQGVDALVFDLPPEARVARAPVQARGSDLLGLHNLDVAFYSETCELVGSLATAAADEAGPLPAGTRFAVVTDRLGIATSVQFQVG